MHVERILRALPCYGGEQKRGGDAGNPLPKHDMREQSIGVEYDFMFLILEQFGCATRDLFVLIRYGGANRVHGSTTEL